MPSSDRRDVTGPMEFGDEKAAEAFLDAALERCAAFTVYKEVRGWYLHPRPGAEIKQPRIDRLLVPSRDLIASGWGYGVIGIECKRSGIPLGRPVAQAIDYQRAAYPIADYGGLLVLPSWVFVFPAPKQAGSLASFMVQNRIGSATPRPQGSIDMKIGEHSMLYITQTNEYHVGDITSGNKTGSR